LTPKSAKGCREKGGILSVSAFHSIIVVTKNFIQIALQIHQSGAK